MKSSRPLAFFLSFLILISCFVAPVSAADTTNLVDANLLNWNTTDPNHVSVNLAAKDVYRVYYKRIPLSSEPDAPGVRAGAVYSLTNLTAGNSYTFNIDLMGVQQIKDSGALQGGTLTADSYYAPLTNYNGELLIGLASYDSTTGSFDTVADGSFVKINGSNYKEYFSKTLTISFTLPNVVNPCIVISYMDLESAGNNCSWYFRNISLVDNAQAEEDSFFARLFEWFQERFDSVGNWFTNLGNSIGNWFADLKESFVNLGTSIVDGIESFFVKFGNLILYFTWDETVPENPFESVDGPLDSVEGFFDDLIDYLSNISNNFADVIDSITGPIHLLDEFTKRFQWLLGIVVFALIMIVVSRFIGL